MGGEPGACVGIGKLKISVVTISCNQARFLRECIESVLSQDHRDVEYIVVDPGSTDGSREIIKTYGDRIVGVFEADTGPADGLNKGFALATGEVFGFVNSDDKLLPGALTCVARAFEARPGVDVITGCGYFIDVHGGLQRRIVPSRFAPWLYARGAVTVFQQGTFFRRTSFEQVNGFNPENRIAWDGELFLDMRLNGACFARIGDNLALFRLHADSITGSGGQSDTSAVYRAYRERIFLKAAGRKRGRIDWALDRIARVAKLVFDPRYLVHRIAAAFRWHWRVVRNSRTTRGAC
jgi:glycosyltransferase involved in cell wall biosynthesis